MLGYWWVSEIGIGWKHCVLVSVGLWQAEEPDCVVVAGLRIWHFSRAPLRCCPGCRPDHHPGTSRPPCLRWRVLISMLIV
jgi:hypothetical protein